jgi:hypothetical protein
VTEKTRINITEDQRKQWTTALRSGDYQQGQSALCRLVGAHKEYCCLGVLADLLGQLVPSSMSRDLLAVGMPPGSVVFRPGELIDEAIQQRLAVMNDGEADDDDIVEMIPAAPFTTIAGWIDENLVGVDAA